MRNGWVFSTRAAALAATTVLGAGATSVQFSVGVTVIAPCSIGVPGALPQSQPGAQNQYAVRLSCADGTKPAVTYEPAPPPATQTVSSTPGLTRVTISY